MPDDRISLRQLLALLFAALLAPAIGVLPSQTAALAVNDQNVHQKSISSSRSRAMM